MKYSYTTVRALKALLELDPEPVYARELSRRTGIGEGTLSKMLTRLESAWWLTSWLVPPSKDSGYPYVATRRYYKLTAIGITEAPVYVQRSREHPEARELRWTRATAVVLSELIARHPTGAYAHLIGQATDIRPPIVSGILNRLEGRGWLTHRVVTQPDDIRGQRRASRKYFSLTETGMTEAREYVTRGAL